MEAEDYIAVEASTDGVVWTEVGRIEGGIYGTEHEYATFNLSNHISAYTTIRFVSHYQPGDYFDNFYLDNVTVRHNGVESPNTGHPTLVDADRLHDQGLTGVGVTVAVVDSGYWPNAALNTTTDYQSRVRVQYDAILDKVDAEWYPSSARMRTATVRT